MTQSPRPWRRAQLIVQPPWREYPRIGAREIALQQQRGRLHLALEHLLGQLILRHPEAHTVRIFRTGPPSVRQCPHAHPNWQAPHARRGRDWVARCEHTSRDGHIVPAPKAGSGLRSSDVNSRTPTTVTSSRPPPLGVLVLNRPRWLNQSLVTAVKAFNGNRWTSQRLELLPRDDRPFYAEDGLWTHHAHRFATDPRFERAYQRAARTADSDFNIRWRVHTLLWAAQVASKADGAFVECGAGRGFMASAICEYLDWDTRPFYLFDSFKPTTPGSCGIQSADGPVNRFYATSAEAVADNFRDWTGVQLVVGTIPATLTHRQIDRVAFLHVDLNHAVAEEAVVRHFWPRVVVGGIMVFDDYGFQGFEVQREAADRLASEFDFSILTSPTGQGIVVKT
jgi:hypothetical protein